MTPDDHTGEMSEWDLLVQRIRAMDDPERDHEFALVKSASYDRGWRDACESLELDLKRNKREFGKRIEDRCWREIRRQQRSDRFQALAGLALCVVIVAALIFMKG